MSQSVTFQHKSGKPVCLIPVQREMDHVGRTGRILCGFIDFYMEIMYNL